MSEETPHKKTGKTDCSHLLDFKSATFLGFVSPNDQMGLTAIWPGYFVADKVCAALLPACDQVLSANLNIGNFCPRWSGSHRWSPCFVRLLSSVLSVALPDPIMFLCRCR